MSSPRLYWIAAVGLQSFSEVKGKLCYLKQMKKLLNFTYGKGHVLWSTVFYSWFRFVLNFYPGLNTGCPNKHGNSMTNFISSSINTAFFMNIIIAVFQLNHLILSAWSWDLPNVVLLTFLYLDGDIAKLEISINWKNQDCLNI